MIRLSLVGVGLFLLAVWISGLSVHSQAWITWLDFVVGLVALGMGAMEMREAGRLGLTGAPIFLALSLFALWIVGLATHADGWIAWCTFVAACALVVAGVIGGGVTSRGERLRPA